MDSEECGGIIISSLVDENGHFIVLIMTLSPTSQSRTLPLRRMSPLLPQTALCAGAPGVLEDTVGRSIFL